MKVICKHFFPFPIYIIYIYYNLAGNQVFSDECVMTLHIKNLVATPGYKYIYIYIYIEPTGSGWGAEDSERDR